MKALILKIGFLFYTFLFTLLPVFDSAFSRLVFIDRTDIFQNNPELVKQLTEMIAGKFEML